jgi:TonB family protein
MPEYLMPGPDPLQTVPAAAEALRNQSEGTHLKENQREEAHLEETAFNSDLADLAARFEAQSGGVLSPELSADLALEIILNEIVEQACLATGASGAAIVLERDGEMVCRASTGTTAPELGSRFNTSSGLSGECFKTRKTQWCDDTMSDPRADAEASERLDVRSLVVMPLLRGEELVGVIELFSAHPYAFGIRDERTLEVLADRTLSNLDYAAKPVAARSLKAQGIVKPQEKAEERGREKADGEVASAVLSSGDPIQKNPVHGNAASVDLASMDSASMNRTDIDRQNIGRQNIDQQNNIDKQNVDRPVFDRPSFDRPDLDQEVLRLRNLLARADTEVAEEAPPDRTAELLLDKLPLAERPLAKLPLKVSQVKIPRTEVSENQIADVPVANAQARRTLVTGLQWTIGLVSAALLGVLLGQYSESHYINARNAHSNSQRRAVSGDGASTPTVTAGGTSSNAASDANAAPAAKPGREGVPPGGLLVLENGKEVFRLPPTENQTAKADQQIGMQRAAAVESESAEPDSSEAGSVMELSPAAAQGSLLERVEPEYPEAARQQNLQGTVMLEVHIAADGTVQDIEVIGGPPLLAQASTDAVKQWKFKPRSVHGRPVEMETKVTLNFRLPQ